MTSATTVTVSTDQLQRVLITFALAVAFFVLLFLALRATYALITACLQRKFGGASGRPVARAQPMMGNQQDYDADEDDQGGNYDDDDDAVDDVVEPPRQQRRRGGGVRKRTE